MGFGVWGLGFRVWGLGFRVTDNLYDESTWWHLRGVEVWVPRSLDWYPHPLPELPLKHPEPGTRNSKGFAVLP